MSKILIVEDEAPNVEILTRMLVRKGFQVLVAGNKQEAITMATAELPDLILMDIGIPNASGDAKNDDGGLEATQQLRSVMTTKAIPIIALTAHVMRDDKKRFLEAGCDAVHSKPFEFGPLLEAIQVHLDRSAASLAAPRMEQP